MGENGKRFRSVLTWVAFLAASTIILFASSSVLHYSPDNSAGTIADEFGTILPYVMFGGLLLYYLLRPIRRGLPVLQGTRSFFSNVGKMLIMPILFLVMIFVVKLLSIPTGGQTQPQESNLPPAQSNPLLGSSGSLSLSPIFFLGVVIAVVSIGILLSVRFAGGGVGAKEELVDLADLDTDGLSAEIPLDKYEVDDFRRAILLRYLRGRALLVRRGAPLDDAMTAREFEKRVVLSFKEASGDFVPLTRLFEEARFSIHPMGDAEMNRADAHYLRLTKISRLGNEEGLEDET